MFPGVIICALCKYKLIALLCFLNNIRIPHIGKWKSCRISPVVAIAPAVHVKSRLENYKIRPIYGQNAQ